MVKIWFRLAVECKSDTPVLLALVMRNQGSAYIDNQSSHGKQYQQQERGKGENLSCLFLRQRLQPLTCPAH